MTLRLILYRFVQTVFGHHALLDFETVGRVGASFEALQDANDGPHMRCCCACRVAVEPC
jgi:hypothetical protein